MNDWPEEIYRTKERLLENELGINERHLDYDEEEINGVLLYKHHSGQIRYKWIT